jgi:multiple sugar transport system permease protein
MTSYNMLQPPKWIGLINYRELILEDDIFLIAIKNTFIFSFITGPITYILSFFTAWILNQIRFRDIFSLAIYSPSLVSSMAISVVWMYIFSPDRYGILNRLLIDWLGITSRPVLWSTDPELIMAVAIIISIWRGAGTGFLSFLAGFQTIPHELYEAGVIDGIKTKLQELWYITVPMVKPQMLFGAIMGAVGTFQVFEQVTSVTGAPISPDYAAHTLVAHLFDHAFIRFEMGYASSVAVILFAITFLLGRLFMKIFSQKGE